MLSIDVFSGGKTTALEVSPDMTIGEFKRELKELQDYEDELMKKMTSVKVIMGETMLVDNDQMIWKAGISPDVILQVCFTVAGICFIVWFLMFQHAQTLCMEYLPTLTPFQPLQCM